LFHSSGESERRCVFSESHLPVGFAQSSIQGKSY
jgi:hypothetical protein